MYITCASGVTSYIRLPGGVNDPHVVWSAVPDSPILIGFSLIIYHHVIVIKTIRHI